MKRGCASREGGFTLVELLIAISILGIGFGALVGGMGTAAVTSDVHRKQAVSSGALRSYAEAIKTEAYVDCATTSTYTGSGYTNPSAFTASVTTVQYFTYSTTDPATISFSGTCPASDQGAQLLTVQVAASDGRATESMQMVKRRG